LALIEGAKAPAFQLPRDAAASSRCRIIGEKLVLFFLSAADTPGCTREAIDHPLGKPHLPKAKPHSWLSLPMPQTQDAFRNKHHLTTPLLSDEKHEMLEGLRVLGLKSIMAGRSRASSTTVS